MKKLTKIICLILPLFLLTSCYVFSRFDLIEFVKETVKAAGGSILLESYKSKEMDNDFYLFYNEYYEEVGTYTIGRYDNLYYYTQLVFDETEAMSFIRYDVGYTIDTKVYESLSTLYHNKITDRTLDLEYGWKHFYDETKKNQEPIYEQVLYNSTGSILRVFEATVCPRMNKTMKDFGFSNF